MILKFQITFECKSNFCMEGAILDNQSIIERFIKCIDKTNNNDNLLGGTLVPAKRVSRDTSEHTGNMWVYTHITDTTHAGIRELAMTIKEEFNNKSIKLEFVNSYFLDLEEV